MSDTTGEEDLKPYPPYEWVANQLDTAHKELASLRGQIEQARNYVGIEGYGCLLCTYNDGVFVRACVPHQQIEELRASLSHHQESVRLLLEQAEWLKQSASMLARKYEAEGYDRMAEEHHDRIAGFDKALALYHQTQGSAAHKGTTAESGKEKEK